MFGGILVVDLVGPDAEAPNHDQVLGFAEDICGEFGL
jgi:hypothetical protein